MYEPGSFTPLAQAVSTAVLCEDDVGAVTRIAHYHCDQIGTQQEVTDEAGELAWSARYRAWGEATEVISDAARKAGIANPLRFAGQYLDRETGLHYNRHRYYDPGSGRFVSKDPIGLAGGVNVYQYAPNPISWIDPLGLKCQTGLSSRAARREAMRQAGIPTSQQPVSQSQNASGREYRYEVPQSEGGTVQATVQQQTMDVSHRDDPHWEAGKVKVDPISGETRMNDYGRPNIANPKGKASYGECNECDLDTPARRRELLYRRSTGKKIFSTYLQKVAVLAPSAGQADLISLESTDALLAEFGARRPALHERRRRISPSGIRLVLSIISKTYKDGAYVLIDEDWKYCGALRIAEPHLINQKLRFGPEIVNDLVFIARDMEKAISLDCFEMDGRTLIDVFEWR